jgi:Flp pilus assembly secretin CpaC
MKSYLRILAATSLLAVPALASPGLKHLSLPLGETRSITLPEKVANIEVTDPAVLKAKKQSNGTVLLSPLSTGKAKVHLRTVGNAEVDLLVFVTSGGDVEIIRRR